MRADARRNYGRLLDEARTAFAEAGTEASLEEIARRAGVGIGTLYRHFPDRYALVEAVFTAEITELRDRAEQLAADVSAPPADRLTRWLRSYIQYARTYGGLSGALLDHGRMAFCHETLTDAAEALVAPAHRAGSLRAEVTVREVLTLATAIAWTTEKLPHDPDRLLELVLNGLFTTPG
ncbi:TetR family transcriptional regulator [Streptomyces tsukubensis]|nr:TetR family transcriptional regulator [Streptomyces tsukubensis]